MKWHKNWKKIVKSYSFLGLLSNLLVAISLTLGTVAERVINATFFWDRGGNVRHCELSYLAEKHLPAQYRGGECK